MALDLRREGIEIHIWNPLTDFLWFVPPCRHGSHRMLPTVPGWRLLLVGPVHEGLCLPPSSPSHIIIHTLILRLKSARPLRFARERPWIMVDHQATGGGRFIVCWPPSTFSSSWRPWEHCPQHGCPPAGLFLHRLAAQQQPEPYSLTPSWRETSSGRGLSQRWSAIQSRVRNTVSGSCLCEEVDGVNKPVWLVGGDVLL